MCTTANSVIADSIKSDAFELNPTPSFVVDNLGIVVLSNQSAKALLDFDDQPVPLLHSLHNGIIGDDSHALIQEILMGASVGYASLHIKCVGGRPEKKCRFTVTPLKKEARKVTQFLLTLVPDSPVSKNFIQLSNAVREANISAAKERLLLKKLEQSHERVSEFSAMAAHDLKAPLRNIDGFLEVLEEDHADDLSADGIEVLHLARKSASRLQQLITDLLDHAKTHNSIVNLEKISLTETVHRVREDLLVVMERCKGRIEVAADIDVIHADRLLFGQLLGNLIGNAVKYRSPDRLLKVHISYLQVSDTNYEITVQDNGLGFDNTMSEKVLQPFQRLHTRTKIEGTGLGLATCKTICDHHGWELSCKGEPDVGATFTIRIQAAA